jgi:hypothetical protein
MQRLMVRRSRPMSRPKLHPGGNRKYGPYGVKGKGTARHSDAAR